MESSPVLLNDVGDSQIDSTAFEGGSLGLCVDGELSHGLGVLKVGRQRDCCLACGESLLVFRYCRDFVVRGCFNCGLCFYWDKGNKRFIELCFSFEDFFEGGSSVG